MRHAVVLFVAAVFGDLDADGLLDIAVATSPDNVSLLPNRLLE